MSTHYINLGDRIWSTGIRCCNGAQLLTETSTDTLTCPACGCEVGVRDQQVAWFTYCPNHRRVVGT